MEQMTFTEDEFDTLRIALNDALRNIRDANKTKEDMRALRDRIIEHLDAHYIAESKRDPAT